jgi:DegV family protein with EDD domain
MASIAIVTDTDSSLPADIATRYGIRQVPINIIFGEETLKTDLEITDAELFARVDRDGALPTTSAPSPGQFVEAYQAAFDGGADAVVCFCVSSAISATYSAAVTAKGTMPERDITVVDTMSVSLGQGFPVLAAAAAAEGGASVDEIVAKALDVRDRTHFYAALSTLKYLAMSGRVGGLAAGMANLLNIKPILTVREGKIDLLEKVRSQRRSWARTIELTGEALAGKPIERMAVFHVAVPEDAQRFQEQAVSALGYSGEVITGALTPGLSVHTGAGLVGVAVVAGS